MRPLGNHHRCVSVGVSVGAYVDAFGASDSRTPLVHPVGAGVGGAASRIAALWEGLKGLLRPLKPGEGGWPGVKGKARGKLSQLSRSVQKGLELVQSVCCVRYARHASAMDLALFLCFVALCSSTRPDGMRGAME